MADRGCQLQPHADAQDHCHAYCCTNAENDSVYYRILAFFIGTDKYHTNNLIIGAILIDRHEIAIIHNTVQRYRIAEIFLAVL